MMFNFNDKEKDDYCPHCSQPEEEIDGAYVETELDDPRDIVDRYYNHFTESVTNEEELYEAIVSLFNESYLYAWKKSLLTDIESKIEALSIVDKQNER